MRPERKVLSRFADEIAKRISRKTISELQRMTDVTTSGDDSGLINIWDEICVQIQSEYFFVWDLYDFTVRSTVELYAEGLKDHERTALWFQTEEGWSWVYDNRDKDEEPPVLDKDIISYIVKDYVYSKADNWTNKRIRAYLDNY